MKKILIAAFVMLTLIALGLFGLIQLASDHKIPSGETGPAAEALRDRIEKAVNLEGFRDLGAVEFTFAAADRRHFYDIQRRLAEVHSGDTVVRFSLDDMSYEAERDGRPLSGEAAAEAFQDAYSYHVNDVFWLNPFAHLRSPGVNLQKIGDQALLVTYASGGVTPGDSYLIVTNETGRPTHWKMWTQIVPIKGMEVSFEDWRNFNGDVPLSLEHQSFITTINITDVKVYDRYPAGEQDRFAALLAR